MKIDRREKARRKGPIRSAADRREKTDTEKARVQRGPDRREKDRRESEDRRKLPTSTIQEF